MLRNHRYAGFKDWEILASVQVGEGGRVEWDTRSKLTRYKTSRPYEKDGLIQMGGKILRCSFTTALNALLEVVTDNERSTLWTWTRAHEYEFGDDD
jgi:hypothetical protein